MCMESRKMVLVNLFAGTENRLVDVVGEGEGGMNGGHSMKAYTLCV